MEASPLTQSANVLPGKGSEKGIFAWMLLELAEQGADADALMIDATHPKKYSTASCLVKKRCAGK